MRRAAAPVQTRVHASAGFTLLEMLVALSILALAALALVRLDAFTVRSTADLSLNALAAITAENVAAQMVSEPGAPARVCVRELSPTLEERELALVPTRRSDDC